MYNSPRDLFVQVGDRIARPRSDKEQPPLGKVSPPGMYESNASHSTPLQGFYFTVISLSVQALPTVEP